MPIRAAAACTLALGAGIFIDAQAAPTGPSLLPAGYLTTSGNQITDGNGHNVRLACTGYVQLTSGIAKDIAAMAADGFNCVRVDYYDATLVSDLMFIDAVVAAAKVVGLKVIINHHGDETPNAGNNYLPYPCNGLPFDSGPGTGYAVSCKGPRTVTRARFVNDWIKVAQHYADKDTVIGFDLTNEPHVVDDGGAHWGDNSVTDLRAIYSEAGDAIQAVNKGPLIIAEGIYNFTGTLANGTPNPIQGFPDLSQAGQQPVTLTYQSQLVYSVHDYPNTIGGTAPDSGVAKVKAMNVTWGYLVSRKIAPVWIGEMGASLDGLGPDSASPAKLTDEQRWAATLVGYVNGHEGQLGGPVFSGCQAPIGTDWWDWGNLDGESPDGTLDDNGKPRIQQKGITRQLAFVRQPGC
jgi:hypothetical protein